MWSALMIWSLNTSADLWTKWEIGFAICRKFLYNNSVTIWWRYCVFKGVIGMIRHLSPEGFRQYGSILPKTRSLSEKPNHHSIFLKGKTVSSYRAVAPLWLGVESGLTVLSVSTDGEQYAEFYLDRAVKLKSGIWFRLAGFRGNAGVQMGGSSMPLSLGQRADTRDFAVRPRVQVQCLYTLFYQEREAGFVFPGEAHPMTELIYVDRGCLHSVADGQDLLLGQGDLALYAPNQWHMQYADPDQAPRIVTISFEAEGLRWETLSNRRFSLNREGVRLLQQILAQQEQADPERIFSLLTLLLLHLQESRENPEVRCVQSDISGENIIIRKAQQYVQENVAQKLTVSAVAEAVGVSASYLTALFQKHLRFSPGEYIRRVKLQQSKQMIREGQMNFTQIAQTLQYSTVHHFSRQFKQAFGMTPTEYGKSVR